MKFDGTNLKDFGEILDCLYNNQLDDYDLYVLSLKGLFSNLQLQFN
jgi:hypothetical protein